MAPGASQPRADATRQRILDSAACLFRERGYSAVSLRDIAAAAEMKAGSVYYHFASKEEIVLAVLDIGIEAVHAEVAETLQRLPEDAPAREVLHAAILSHLRSLFEYSDYTSANVRIYHQVPEDVRKANAAARRRYERLWDRILKRLQAAGVLRADLDLKKLRLLLIGAMNATLDWFTPRKGAVAALAASYADMLGDGILDERAGR